MSFAGALSCFSEAAFVLSLGNFAALQQVRSGTVQYCVPFFRRRCPGAIHRFIRCISSRLLTRFALLRAVCMTHRPDECVNWSHVQYTRLLADASVKCPLCLGETICPRISECGHVYVLISLFVYCRCVSHDAHVAGTAHSVSFRCSP